MRRTHHVFVRGLKKLKRFFGAGSSDGLQEQLASLRLAVEQGEETIRSLRAELLAVKEELRAAKQELATEKATRQVAEAAPADERGASAALKEVVRKQSLELHSVLARLATDSGNSSKPPSSNFPKKSEKSGNAKPDAKSLRKRSDHRPGAQKGHKGAGFSLPEGPPDKTVYCLPSQRGGCALAGLCADRERVAGTRYVVDYVVKVENIVYKAVARKCPLRGDGTLAREFPEEAGSTKQYGRRLRRLPVAMFNCCTYSFDKISGFLSELMGLKLSVGWCWEQYDKAGHRGETDACRAWRTRRLSPCPQCRNRPCRRPGSSEPVPEWRAPRAGHDMRKPCLHSRHHPCRTEPVAWHIVACPFCGRDIHAQRQAGRHGDA